MLEPLLPRKYLGICLETKKKNGIQSTSGVRNKNTTTFPIHSDCIKIDIAFKVYTLILSTRDLFNFYILRGVAKLPSLLHLYRLRPAKACALFVFLFTHACNRKFNFIVKKTKKKKNTRIRVLEFIRFCRI